jgi:hypothetical protein
MTRFAVPTLRDRKGMLSDLHGCTGATMEDGTRYLANRAGVIEVENPAHARAIRRDPNIAGDIVQIGAAVRRTSCGRPGRYCTAHCCITEYQPWTKVCPGCGAPTAAPGEVPSGAA